MELPLDGYRTDPSGKQQQNGLGRALILSLIRAISFVSTAKRDLVDVEVEKPKNCILITDIWL